MFVIKGDGRVSQFQGTYSEYFMAFEAGGGKKLGFIERITGFDSPLPHPVAVVVAPITPSNTVTVRSTVETAEKTAPVRLTKPTPKPTTLEPKSVNTVVPKIDAGPAPSQWKGSARPC